MEYTLSVKQFSESQMFDSKGKLHHKTGIRFKLFPYVTQNNSYVVDSFQRLAGAFLCQIEHKKPVGISVKSLVEKLQENTTVETGLEDVFCETVKQLFFDEDGQIRPLNVILMAQNPCKETSEEKIVEYLVDVLGNQEELSKILQNALQLAEKNSNVFERLVSSKLEYIVDENTTTGHYFRVVQSLSDAFVEDFSFVLDNSIRTREYLVPLLEFYCFTYTAQACMQLGRFLAGERESNVPLYFCLDWERTSQSRLCYHQGWQILQSAIEKMFAHAVVLEILNQTEPGAPLVDYISLSEMIKDDPNRDSEVAKQVKEVTDFYRMAVTDCPIMKEIVYKNVERDKTEAAVRFLFESVKSQFENSVRRRAYGSYASKFEVFCQKFLKNRGRSGKMLNLTEENLIFLTKLAIKNRDQLRLKEVFDAFQARGVFLDDLSKEQVATYYEKLNLIEKKSDSGDAKYVKRIL